MVKGLLLLCLFAFLPFTLLAQVKATIEPIEIMIGQQARVTLTVDGDASADIEWPTLSARQQIVDGVEIVSVSHPETNTMQIVLTSFDGNLYHLPPLKVKVGGKETQTADLALKVNEVEVDTTQLDKMCPPKDVQDNPFLWSEWSPLFGMSVLLLLLVAVGVYLLSRLLAGKPVIAHIKIVRRLLPHQKAMQQIEQIKADKMVASENQKEYYTKLTDTLRRYIEERYGFSAMEMTSSQIIERLTASGDQKSLDELRQLFNTADLVKFAKYSTLINENDANLVNAIDFINQTKLENVPTEEVQKPQLSAEDQRSQKERKVLKTVLWTISIVSLAMIAYIVYEMWQLLM